ncbi:hypothetical protein HJC23_007151 [Cyclotella cryptica]|uniref:Protein arginine N-methyltransferase 1 n=1 Tax=Cyclotella cryptica TaxID=29204 RepID=A0ABD3QRY7_9STRA|eukprot:CCRYP_003395-RB/>CCRYP_003395-RB protein AED:0.02 eAED:0.02 QI:153/1/1/1/1/0.66/3/3134/408
MSSLPPIDKGTSDDNDAEECSNDEKIPEDTNNAQESTKQEEETQGDTQTSKDYYFDSYSHHGIHEEMLKDEVRTRTYQMAMLNNKHLFEGKIVLDVGCGTGILSMFAVQAGASHVYGVDCSSIIDHASRIVETNGFGDKITLIKAKMEDVELPVPYVDIIVSEWMGYFLLYESMLNTVLYARDKWLKKDGGVVFPDQAVLYICAIEDEQMKKERIDFWNDVYGFDMSALGEVALKEPVVDVRFCHFFIFHIIPTVILLRVLVVLHLTPFLCGFFKVVEPRAVVTNAAPILSIDIMKCKAEDLSFSSSFQLRPIRNDKVHAFVSYFECAFTRIDKPLGFSTSPWSTYTHWKQTIFYMTEAIYVQEGEELVGTVTCKPNQRNERDLNISISYKFEGQHSKYDGTTNYMLR